MARQTHDFKTMGFGERAGSATAVQMPTQACKRVVIKAKSDNAGLVYIGKSDVTVPNEVADTTSGFPLDAGESVELYVGNLNQLYYICDNAGDALAFLWQG